MSPILLALIGATVVAAAVISALARNALALFAVAMGIAAVGDRRSRQVLRTLRAGEDIGTFVRALDRRDPAFDRWVVRAVWDALRAALRAGGVGVPLRPGEVPMVAARSGRSLAPADLRASPMVGRVQTVADLIQFVALQPRRAATQ
jgi:hypothetical protein